MVVTRGLPVQVAFLKLTGELVRMGFADEDTASMCRAARDLKARYFVAPDPMYVPWKDPLRINRTYAVFDMRTAQKDNPTPGAWSINDPRVFPTLESAEMWAIHQGRR